MMPHKKTYLIIGASSDIGMALIKDMIESLNEELIIIAHFRKKNDTFLELEKSIHSHKSRVDFRTIQADLSNPDAIYEFIENVKKENILITHIVHLPASRFSYVRIKELDWKKISEDMEIHIHSLLEVFKEFLPSMAKINYGKVVVMLASCVYNTPPKFMTNYLISKYALLGLMKGAAVEYAAKGIHINGISPNMMETKFLDNINKRVIEMNKENSLIKRTIRLNEVVAGIEFLLSDKSGAMYGVNLNLSGGECMR
ncbi:MAG: SDR family oxidoreductase [Bacteroidales bacterium]|nr:SDR family oxidoreductase [Bacteroidales bacterium]